jgi:dUTP pyrophosphatase
MLDVKIKRVDTSLPLPEYATPGACGFDLYSRTDISIEPNQIVLVPSNLIIATPADHVLLLTPRSSLARKKGLIMPNSVGVIDQDYAGDNDEVIIQLQNISDKLATIEKGERIAQGLFVPIAKASWQEVTAMNEKDRGGFGSTGGYNETSPT